MYIFPLPGGQLGLWVGVSAITLCEILGFFSKILHIILGRGLRSFSKTTSADVAGEGKHGAKMDVL